MSFGVCGGGRECRFSLSLYVESAIILITMGGARPTFNGLGPFSPWAEAKHTSCRPIFWEFGFNQFIFDAPPEV